eukprot:15473698-Alexandrium_andersonii.AAC.1
MAPKYRILSARGTRVPSAKWTRSGGPLQSREGERGHGGHFRNDYRVVCIFNIRKGKDRGQGQRHVFPKAFFDFRHDDTEGDDEKEGAESAALPDPPFLSLPLRVLLVHPYSENWISKK